jgi:hypothetical protein
LPQMATIRHELPLRVAPMREKHTVLFALPGCNRCGPAVSAGADA